MVIYENFYLIQFENYSSSYKISHQQINSKDDIAESYFSLICWSALRSLYLNYSWLKFNIRFIKTNREISYLIKIGYWADLENVNCIKKVN